MSVAHKTAQIKILLSAVMALEPPEKSSCFDKFQRYIIFANNFITITFEVARLTVRATKVSRNERFGGFVLSVKWIV